MPGTSRELGTPCPNCGRPVSAEAAYCLGCGVPLQDTCRTCGGVNPIGSRFCGHCGADLAADAFPESGDARPHIGVTFAAGTPAGFWVRVAARLVDGAVLLVAQLIVIAIWPGESLSTYFAEDQTALWTTLDSVLVIGNALYYVLGLSIWSTTVGKRLMGIYVLRPDGAKLGPGRAFARYLAEALSFLLLLSGYLMVAFRQDKRSLHDLICDTVVVRRQ